MPTLILLTVGTQLPFDRLIRAVDELAPSLGETVFAQTGKTSYTPLHMGFASTVEPVAFDTMARRCSKIVAHAGIGTVLLARRYCKPIILVPRQAALHEHRTNHQIATATALRNHSGIYIADDTAMLPELLTRSLSPPAIDDVPPGRKQLNDTLFDFIQKTR